MINKHDTDPDTPDAKNLRRRLDSVDDRLARLDGLAEDVAGLGHGLGELTNRVTALTQATNHGTSTGPDTVGPDTAGTSTAAAEDTDAEDAQEREGQPDWLTVTDPDAAAAWLTDAVAFADEVLARFPHGSLPACWLVHEVAVVDVIALRRQWVDAYASPDPGAVSYLLGRWLPDAVRRLCQATGECRLQRGHQEAGHSYQIPALEPARVALWWVETRGTDPTAVEAFAMIRLS